MKRGITLILALVMLCSVLLMPTYAVVFSDLDSGHWAYEYITTLADNGVINGYTDGTFRPSGTITRAEFIKLITVATIGENEANNIVIPDDYYLSGKWYARYVYWAEENYTLADYFSQEQWESNINRIEMVRILYLYSEYLNLLEKYQESLKNNANKEFESDFNVWQDSEEPETVGPEDKLLESMIAVLNDMGYKKLKYRENTREEVDVIIEKLSEKERESFEKLLDEKLGINKEENKLGYNDLETLDNSDIAYLDIISKLGLINGYEDGSFKPYKFMSRAEVATIIYRYNDKKGELCK